MGTANPSITLDIISYTRHGQKETAYFNNLLLDNIELPIDITLVNTPKEVTTPSLLNNNQAALKHLKLQILTEIKNDLDKNNTNIKKIEIQNPRNSGYDLIRELRQHIQTLQSEVHFLREELKEKSVLLRSLIIASNNKRNKKFRKNTRKPGP